MLVVQIYDRNENRLTGERPHREVPVLTVQQRGLYLVDMEKKYKLPTKLLNMSLDSVSKQNVAL